MYRPLISFRLLKRLDYAPTRQRGSHIRVTTLRDGEHHEVIPNYDPLKLGTLHNILKNIAAHHSLTVDELIGLLKISS